MTRLSDVRHTYMRNVIITIKFYNTCGTIETVQFIMIKKVLKGNYTYIVTAQAGELNRA